jgi:hypothetical protein
LTITEKNNLSQVSDLLQKHFPDTGWLNSHGLAANMTITDREDPLLVALSDKLVSYTEIVFSHLNKSILTGEFINTVETTDGIKQIREKIKALDTTEEPIENGVLAHYFNSGGFKTHFYKPIEEALDFYHEFLANFERKIGLSSAEYIYRERIEVTRKIENSLYEDSIKSNLKFFRINIAVTNCDLFLSIDKDQISSLTSHRESILGISNQLSNALIKKIDFLKLKLLLTYKQLRIENESDHSGELVIVERGGRKTIIGEDSLKTTNLDFKDFNKRIGIHYEINTKWRLEIEDSHRLNSFKDLGSCNILELYDRIKYCKDVLKNVDRLKEIRLELHNRLKGFHQQNDSFCIYAYSINLNYAINNEFSCLCAQENATLDKVFSLYKDVMAINQETGVRNFFPQVKFLGFLLDELDKAYSSNGAEVDLSKCRHIINLSNEVMKAYFTNVEWTKNNYNLKFQLPYAESIVSVQHDTAIYVFSSFILPLSKSALISDFNDTLRKIEARKNSLVILENIETRMGALQAQQAKISTLESDVKAREIKAIEIIGVFTALVTFVATSVQKYPTMTNPYQAALFTLALASSFSFFVLLLMFALKEFKNLHENRFLVIGFMLVTFLLWFVVIKIGPE